MDKLIDWYPTLNNYYYFSDGFTVEECDRIVNKFRLSKREDALTFNNNTEHRKTKISWIEQNDNNNWIYEKLFKLIKIANKELYRFHITGIHDLIQFSEYEASFGGKYDKHIDVGDGNINACRKLSVILQLSDENIYEGGDVCIRDNPISRKQGTVVVFPSFLEHNVNMVTSGTRHSLVLWVYGPPFV